MSGALILAAMVTAVSATAHAMEVPRNDEDAACHVGTAPDLARCSALGAAGGLGRLKAIACVVEAINEWQHEQLRCLEEQVQDRTARIIFPVRQVLAQVGMTLRDVDTLREEVERMACDWRFSPRTRLLEGVYIRKVRLCRPSLQLILGRHGTYGSAPFHELASWSSALTHNLIAERTGLALDQGAEATWMYTATSVAGGHIENMRSPGQAVRLAATSGADALRARNSTLQMQAQRLLVGEELRAWRALRQAQEAALQRQITASIAAWPVRSSAGTAAGP